MDVTSVWVHDTRVSGSLYEDGGSRVIRVNEATTLSDMVTRVINESIKVQTRFLLKILAHGTGGQGILLCQEGLDLNTVHALSHWRQVQNFSMIWLIACKAADQALGSTLCSRIAQISGKHLWASPALQKGSPGLDLLGLTLKYIDPGRWEGPIYHYQGGTGALVGRTLNPKI
ncbi:MAG: hypothetical protein HY822_18485 [Acidobacteria bacterium]|nr:hypothetical protein [Acidobacteriota bacterium]